MTSRSTRSIAPGLVTEQLQRGRAILDLAALESEGRELPRQDDAG